MTYVCSSCGKVHDKMPQYFMLRRPDEFAHDDSGLVFDEEFACRNDDRDRYFVRCELELPIEGLKKKVLGIICWAEVSQDTYVSYLSYRQHLDDKPRLSGFEELVDGKLANELPRIPTSLGTTIKFKALPRDRTPYIRWVSPGTSLAERVRLGATADYWHYVATEW